VNDLVHFDHCVSGDLRTLMSSLCYVVSFYGQCYVQQQYCDLSFNTTVLYIYIYIYALFRTILLQHGDPLGIQS
jgi:hypothetical protein